MKTREPLPGASVFDSNGNFLGVSSQNGSLPLYISKHKSLTVRYIGYEEFTIVNLAADTIFLTESPRLLPEVLVETKEPRVMHLIGYVREYSSLATYDDTIHLFREKMVDYMIPASDKGKFKGWKMPRVLKSKSYYRFTNKEGLDSVSDKCSYHFSWGDWVAVLPTVNLPTSLVGEISASDTIMGRFSPTEIWRKNGERLNLYINVLADTTSRKWVPNLRSFFDNYVDFDEFKINYSYSDVGESVISALDLSGYSFNIESTGRGRTIYLFKRPHDKYFVSSYAEVYILDKEFISVKEAKRWQDGKFDFEAIDLIRPEDAAPLQETTLNLIARVDSIDSDAIRVDTQPDQLLKFERKYYNTGQRVLQRIKGILGIDRAIGNRKRSKEWHDFKQKQIKNNKLNN